MTQNVNIAVKTESGQVKKISQGVIFSLRHNSRVDLLNGLMIPSC